MLSAPLPMRWSNAKVMSGFPAMGTSGFGLRAVRVLSRVPRPAPRTNALRIGVFTGSAFWRELHVVEIQHALGRGKREADLQHRAGGRLEGFQICLLEADLETFRHGGPALAGCEGARLLLGLGAFIADHARGVSLAALDLRRRVFHMPVIRHEVARVAHAGAFHFE